MSALFIRFLTQNVKKPFFGLNGRQNFFSLKFNLNIIVVTVFDPGRKFHVNRMQFDEVCEKKLRNGNFSLLLTILWPKLVLED